MPRKNSAKKHSDKEETQKPSEEQRRLDRISPEKYMEKGDLHIAYHGRKERVSPDSVFYEFTDKGRIR